LFLGVFVVLDCKIFKKFHICNKFFIGINLEKMGSLFALVPFLYLLPLKICEKRVRVCKKFTKTPLTNRDLCVIIIKR